VRALKGVLELGDVFTIPKFASSGEEMSDFF
jgi:hypothetical protein